MSSKKKIVIIGAGSAGISVAARLARRSSQFEIALIDPSNEHYYQPLWTLVGGGEAKKEKTQRKMRDLIPEDVQWVKDSVEFIEPDQKQIRLKESLKALRYDALVVCPGIQINWDKIEGLTENLGKNGVCSNYSYDYVDSTWDFIQKLQSGKAIFTHPNTPIKCGGAPQKIMYLAQDYFRMNGLSFKIDVEFATAGDKLFAVPKYREVLEQICKNRNINVFYHLNLEKIDGQNKIAYFKNLQTGQMVEKEYNLLHVTPPMSAPFFIRNSPLADSAGWVSVNKHSLQSSVYPEVFSLGDASNLPTSKTGAAIRAQVPVLVNNLVAFLEGKELIASYDGYTSCPIVTGYGKLILAEFDYAGNPKETFPFDQAKERKSMYYLKKYLLPPLYWHGMLKGHL